MFDLTGSPSRVALVGVVRMTPLLLFGLGIGTVVDRASKRRLVAFAHSLVVAAIASVVVATAAGTATPLHLYLAVFASGIGFAADFSAHRALMAHLVPRSALGTVAALDTTTLTGSYLLGPSLAGLAIGTVGYTGAYALLLALVGCSLALVLSVPRDPPGGPPARRLRLVQALRAVAANRTVLAVLLITMVMNACAFPYQFMLPVIARDELAVGPVAYGLLGSAAGLGALFSALAAGAVPPRLAGRVFSGGSLLLLCCIVVFALSRSYPLSVAVLFVGGFGFRLLRGAADLRSAAGHRSGAARARPRRRDPRHRLATVRGARPRRAGGSGRCAAGGGRHGQPRPRPGARRGGGAAPVEPAPSGTRRRSVTGLRNLYREPGRFASGTRRTPNA